MKKVLVTGAGGFLGNTLCLALANSGFHVTAFDRFFFGADVLPDVSNIHKITGDIRKISEKDFEGINYVFDLASICNDAASEYFNQETYEINYRARERVCDLSKKSGVEKYILISSCAVYGQQTEICHESSQLNPISTYAKANSLAEAAVLSLQGSQFSVTALRLATVFGYSARMRLDLPLNKMIYDALSNNEIKILNGGEQFRPFIYIDDISDALIHVLQLEKDLINGEIFNVGDNALNFNFIEIAERVQKVLGEMNLPVPRIFKSDNSDKRSYVVNFTKINDKLNWHSKLSLEEGIKKTIQAFMDNKLETRERHFTLEWYQKLEQEYSSNSFGGIIKLTTNEEV